VTAIQMVQYVNVNAVSRKAWTSEAFDICQVALSLMEGLTKVTITVEVLVQEVKLLPESLSR